MGRSAGRQTSLSFGHSLIHCRHRRKACHFLVSRNTVNSISKQHCTELTLVTFSHANKHNNKNLWDECHARCNKHRVGNTNFYLVDAGVEHDGDGEEDDEKEDVKFNFLLIQSLKSSQGAAWHDDDDDDDCWCWCCWSVETVSAFWLVWWLLLLLFPLHPVVSWTLMNLKWPILPLHVPIHVPVSFLAMMFTMSPFLKANASLS